MLISCFAIGTSAANTAEIQRYNVLVLDVSGSMEGEAINALKRASTAFCEQVLDPAKGYDVTNRIAIVTFSTNTKVLCDFTNDINKLKNAISNIHDEDMTDLAGGILKAKELLQKVDDSAIKNILIMCDGLPNIPSWETGAQAAYDAAASVPIGWNIYGLYFGQAGYDEDCLKVMQTVARTECYDASDFNQLITVFAEDWSQQATTKRVNNLIIRIACPVEVSVELNGIVLDRNNPKTLFGTIEFEGIGDDEVKIVKLSYSDNYKISVVGTGVGTMDYTISYRCNDEELYSLTYPTINITPVTTVTGSVSFDDKTITLDVDTNGDGVVDNQVSGTASDGNGSGDQTIDKSKLSFFQRLKLYFKEILTEFYDHLIRLLNIKKSYI